MEIRASTSLLHRYLDRPNVGTICTITGLIGAIATAPLCFGLLSIPAVLSSVGPFLLPAFIFACYIFVVGVTMVSYHLFTRRPSQKDHSGKSPVEIKNQSQMTPADPASKPIDPKPNPQPASIEPPNPKTMPVPDSLKYLRPEDYPPFDKLMPPLSTHSPTDWLQNAYDHADNSQKIHLQIKLKNGRSKDVYVMILRGDDLMADRGNATGQHKDWDIITEAANPNLVSGGNTAGITYNHYGNNGWKEMLTFKRFRAYQEGRQKYFITHAEYFRKMEESIPAHFHGAQIACGEVLTNEGADHGKPHGFQALTHILGPSDEADMPKLKTGYEGLGREFARINAHSVHITGVSEAIYGRDPVACAESAINGFLDSLVTNLQNADPPPVDESPVYAVFGRFNSRQSYAASDDPATWTGGDAAYRDNLKIWKEAHPSLCR
ncbi:MAG: hypothetical protein LBD72_02775 [Puniceicoccales bacterium]|jgi:hypothetical protein|nr:hypothetical protein [Puniceicoccales bacterium]